MTRRRRRPTPTRALLAALALLLLPALVRAQTTVVEYYHLDALGTVRAVTDQAGAVVERHDYLPYGEEWCGTAVCSSPTQGQPLRFTGKERDAETGLDYFGARYYGSKIGRFTTTDPVYDWKEDIAEPQRWNRYAYARNNPLRYVDPDGRRDGKTGLDMRQVQANADAIGKVLVNTVRAINSPGHMSAEKARAYYEQPDSPDQALRMDVADLLLTAWLGATLVKKGPEGPYDYIPDGPSVGPGKPFTQSQKAKIYEANRQRNGGVLRSDCSGCELAPSERSMKGVPTPPNAAQVDHNLARSRGGSNSFTNARVLSAQENQTKGAN